MLYIKNFHISLIAVLLMGSFIQSCSDLVKNTKYLTVRVVGVPVAPEGATGSYDPIWQEYTMEGVYLSPDPDADGELSLYSGDPTAFKVIDRPQIIYKREIPSGWVGEKFDSLFVRFSTSVTAAGKYADDYKLELLESDIGNAEGFTVEKGQGIAATINIQWKNTVTRDDASVPPIEDWIVPTFDVSILLD